MMPDYRQLLEAYMLKREQLRAAAASEAAIRAAFLHFTSQAFPSVSSDDIDLERHLKLPVQGAGARIRHGFVDAVYGDLIFEFKRELDATSRAQGESELAKYLDALPHSDRRLGVLSDGILFRVYSFQEGTEPPVQRLQFRDEFRLDPATADDGRLRLDTYFFHARQQRPTARDIALRFGEHSPVFWGSLRTLQKLWSRVHVEPGAQTKMAEWRSLLAIVYGAPVGDDDLFLRHTYLVCLARLLAFSAVQGRVPSRSEVSGILTGDTFAKMGLPDFVTDDFFSWLAEPSLSSDVTEWSNSLAIRLGAAYDLGSVDEDLLKALYQELVDPKTRHDLGEFYTPDWLAERTLREAGFPRMAALKTGDDRQNALFDPSCGSGTFLFTAVRSLRAAGIKGKRLVAFCTRQLAGVDVHPLAVIISKANLIMSLGQDLLEAGKDIRLPVYMANSLALARRALVAPIEVPVDVASLSTRTGKPRQRDVPGVFDVPCSDDDPERKLDQCLDALLRYASPQFTKEDALGGFEKALAGVLSKSDFATQRSAWRANMKLMRWLMEKPPTDSVWRFVLHNAVRPELLARRCFAFVVGNPPWLAYRFIQSPEYQREVREKVFGLGLLGPRQQHLVTQMELATLFFVFCRQHYLADDGVLAFVMPRSVLTGAKQHQAFQRDHILYANAILDCKPVEPLFNVPACVIITGKDGKRRSSVPVVELAGQLAGRNLTWALAAPHLKERRSSFSVLAVGQKSPYFPMAVQGATIVPRSFWFVRPPEQALVVSRDRPYLETDPIAQAIGKPPWNKLDLSGPVEADFLYATLLSSNLLPFAARRFSLVILPLRGRKVLASTHAFREGFPGAAAWFREAERLWKAKRKSSRMDLVARLDYQKLLSRQRPTRGYRVVFNRSGTHIAAAVIKASAVRARTMRKLRTRGFAADFSTYCIDTDDRDEAFYLAAYLNAPSVDDEIKRHQTEGLFGAHAGKGQRDVTRRPLEVLPWPRFDPADPRHSKLAKLSRIAHARAKRWLDGLPPAQRDGPHGRLRTALRRKPLRGILAKIDRLVRAILKRRPTASGPVAKETLY